MSDPLDLSTLSADDITRIASFYPLGIVAAIAADQAALVTGGATTADLTKLHAITATAAEASTLHSSGITNADLIKVHAVTAAAATLNQVAAAAGTVTFDRSVKIAKVALATADTGGGVFSWTNPEAGSIVITKVVVDVTTIASGACSIDIGTTATNGTTQSDTLIDGLDVHSATGVFDLADQAGANGKTRQRLASGAWVTGSKDSGTAAALAGSVYLHYMNV